MITFNASLPGWVVNWRIWWARYLGWETENAQNKTSARPWVGEKADFNARADSFQIIELMC
jgi:hypothetical protein